MDIPGPSEWSVSPHPPENDRLDSWKEIAAYLRRDESTVRRWGKNGLPVHRHVHRSRAAVYAYKKELDAWWNQERAAIGSIEPDTPDSVSPTAQHLPIPPAASAALPGKRSYFRVAATVLAIAAIAATAARLVFTDHTRSATAPFALTAFMNMGGDFSYPALSPDGKEVVFSWANPQLPGTEIFVKLVGSEVPLQLTFDKGADDFSAAWSPDGREIVFLKQTAEDTGVFVVPALGGPERKLVALKQDRYYAVDWSPNGGTIAFGKRASPDDPYAIFLVPSSGGPEKQISFPEQKTDGDVRFAFSPDGRYLAVLRHTSSPVAPVAIMVIPSGGGDARMVYGHNEWVGALAWSADGRSLVLAGNRDGVRKLWRVYLRDGHEELLSEMGEDGYYPSISRQGGRISFVREVVDSDLWQTELASPHGPGREPIHMISSTRVEGAPQFSPDGRRLVFQSYRSGAPEIWVSDADGGNAVQLTFFRTSKPESPRWSPDGQTIAFGEAGADQVVSVAGGQPRRLSTDIPRFDGPVWSRDGQSIYYRRVVEKGETQIWKAPVAGGKPVQVTRNGGFSAKESPDGKFLYYTKATVKGIWRMPAGGGTETLVLKEMEPSLPGYWDVFDDGLYYVNVKADSKPAIEFYNFATRRSIPLVAMSNQPDPWFGGMTLSPDRKRIVFSQRQYQSSEILLGENFR